MNSKTVSDANSLLTENKLLGLRLFIGKGGCVACHFGMKLSDGEFHDVRVPPLFGSVEPGRYEGVKLLMKNEFNLLSKYSDAKDSLVLTRFLTSLPSDWARFKTPTLRRISFTAPYMHQGQFSDLESVINFYSSFNGALPTKHHADSFLLPRNFSNDEKRALIDFLKIL